MQAIALPPLPQSSLAQNVAVESPPARSRDARLVWGSYFASVAILVLAWAPLNFAQVAAFRSPNFDLGIYSQAIYLLSWDEPNPWLSVRQIHIFNDHFDPILFVAAPLAKLIEPAYAALIVELLFVVASPLPIIWLWRRGDLSAEATAIVVFYLLHSRGIVQAVAFPVHPTTWALLPATWLAAAIFVDHRRGVLVSLLLMLCCKEEFPFLGLATALVYLHKRAFRFATLLGLISLTWGLSVLWLRPKLFGPTSNYQAARLLLPEGFWATVVDRWRHINVRSIGHIVAPLAPLAAWLVWRGGRPNWRIWTVMTPTLAIRFLGKAWHFHYMAPLVPWFVLGVTPRAGQARPPRWLVAAVAVISLAVNCQFWFRSSEFLRCENPENHMPANAPRIASLTRGRDYLRQHREGTALVQGNLLTRLVDRAGVHQVGNTEHVDNPVFRYVFVEAPGYGDPWPQTYEEYAHLVEAWRAAPNTRVILDDGHAFLAEGQFHDLGRPLRR